MLKEYEKFRFVDEAKNNEFYAEVNWNPKDKESNECKLIKFTFPNGETSVVRKDVFNAVLFAMGTPEQQQKMIPQTTSRVRWYETTLSVRLKKDLRKGEMMTFPVKLSLPPIEEEVIREIGVHLQKKGRI